MGKLNEHKWQIVAAAFLVAGFIMARGSGLSVLAPTAKVLLPVVVVYFVIRAVSKKIGGGVTGAFRSRIEAAMKQMQDQQARQQGGGGGKVIDLCPKCGSYLTSGHRCKKA